MIEKSSPLRILFAEDDDALRVALRYILVENAGYEVEACSSGEEAVAFLKQRSFDVIILDYKMPGMSGLNVLQWMYEQKMETPVLILTGAGSETIAVEAMKLGAYDYLRKEYLEIGHLPIIINGVYERYLFKKEREERALTEQKNIAHVTTFHETVSPIAHILKQVLLSMSSNLQNHERNLKSVVKPGGQRQLSEAFAALQQDYSVISSAINSILDVGTVLYDEFGKECPERIPEAERTKPADSVEVRS